MKYAFVLFAFLLSGQAQATLLGDTVSCATTGTSWSCDPVSTLVTDPGIEFGINVHTSFRSMAWILPIPA